MATWLTDANGNRCSGAEILRTLRSAASVACIMWTGYSDPKGYGRVWFNGRWSLTHRVSYELNVAPIPIGMNVCHACDNPGCINPRHLFLGTQIINMRDRASKGRTARGQNNGRSKLVPSAVETIRASTDSTRVLGKQFGISSSQVSYIKNRKT